MNQTRYDQSLQISGKELVEEVDVCVIGSGAGGGVIASELACRRHRVVLLEAGGFQTKKDFNQREFDMNRKLYWENRLLESEDTGVGMSVARLVGGGTGVNDGVALRSTAENLDRWVQDGLKGYSRADLDPYYEKVEEIMHAQTYPRFEWNRNNTLFAEGLESLGEEPHPVPVYIVECHKSGFCNLGCKYNSKQGNFLTYLPRGFTNGLRLYANTEAYKINLNPKGEAYSVDALISTETKGFPPTALKVLAKVVVLAAGPIYTTMLLLKNGLANSSGNVGRGLSNHPSIAVIGVHDREVHQYRGTPIQVDKLYPLGQGNYVVEANKTYPMELSYIIPGWGKEHKERMKKLNYFQNIYTYVSEDEPIGTVTINKRTGKPSIKKPLTEKDKKAFSLGMAKAKQILKAVGAGDIFTTHYVSAHIEGMCRMGPNPKKDVVNLHGETYDVPRLFIGDASVFPRPVAVNPSLTIMAIAHKTAEYIDADEKGYFG
ncbi:MAG: GMC family oxidoreductase [Actinobacteria bacterium]|nr:MAG: GMC family oxidoreductase [Actinomycetota bacterium]